MVRAVNVGAIPKRKIYESEYSKLRGVDFSVDPALVDKSRSPWAPNMISDAGGNPEKRPGYRTLKKYNGRVNGIHGYLGEILVHAGTEIHLYGGALLMSGVNDYRSSSFYYAKRLFILTGREYLVYDGTTLKEVEGFVPTTHIGMYPATGAGTYLEDFNMLTGKRTNSFLAPAGGASVFVLDSANIDAAPVTALVSGVSKTEGVDFTVDRMLGAVTFGSTIPDSHGVDTVQITFSKEIAGARSNIEKCSICSWFGMGNDSRVFVSGNPDYPHLDYMSYLYDPTYFPSSGWAKVGSDASEIMGYIRQFDNQVIIKRDNASQEASIYSRTAEIIGGQAVFPIKQGVAGVGAVSKYAFDYLRDDPLFVSLEGVCALTLAYGASAQRTVQNRSFYVNARLAKMDLSNAVSCVWDGYYLLSVGDGEVFIADSRQKSGGSGAINNDSFVYEWYHWTNVPARVWRVDDNELYFGAPDGRFCKFNTDSEGVNRYSDDGEAIVASWMTKADDDGDFMTRKTMPKRGTGAMLKPYDRSSVTVYAMADINGNPQRRDILSNFTVDIFDFNDIDFTRFTFRTSSSPAIIPFDTKIKKYSTLYFVLLNGEVNEGFGIYGLIKRYVHGNYLKRGF